MSSLNQMIGKEVFIYPNHKYKKKMAFRQNKPPVKSDFTLGFPPDPIKPPVKIDFTLDDINAKEYARRFNVDVCDVREMIKEEAVDMLFTYYRNEDLISR